jgi:hypothetical protein
MEADPNMRTDEQETPPSCGHRSRQKQGNVLVGRPVPDDSVREVQPERLADGLDFDRTRSCVLLGSGIVLGFLLVAIGLHAIASEDKDLLNRLLDMVTWGGGLVLTPIVGAKAVEVLRGSGSSHGP